MAKLAISCFIIGGLMFAAVTGYSIYRSFKYTADHPGHYLTTDGD